MNTNDCRDERGKALEPWVRETKLFKHSECLRQEITLHKWYESERAGCDIGWERAKVDYMVKQVRAASVHGDL